MQSAREQFAFFLEISVELLSQSCLAPFVGAHCGPQMLLQMDNRSLTGATSIAMSHMSDNMYWMPLFSTEPLKCD